MRQAPHLQGVKLNQGALLHWLHQQGLEGVKLNQGALHHWLHQQGPEGVKLNQGALHHWLHAPAGTGRCKAEPKGTPPPAVAETVETKFTSSPLDEKKSIFSGHRALCTCFNLVWRRKQSYMHYSVTDLSSAIHILLILGNY